MTDKSNIQGSSARHPDPVSGAYQDYNDPGPDSLFEKVDGEANRCSICGQLVYNNTESRDAHLAEQGCHCAEIIAAAIPGVLLEPAEEKPYGRLAWEIYPLESAGHVWGHGFDRWYIDLSVMPRMGAQDV